MWLVLAVNWLVPHFYPVGIYHSIDQAYEAASRVEDERAGKYVCWIYWVEEDDFRPMPDGKPVPEWYDHEPWFRYRFQEMFAYGGEKWSDHRS